MGRPKDQLEIEKKQHNKLNARFDGRKTSQPSADAGLMAPNDVLGGEVMNIEITRHTKEICELEARMKESDDIISYWTKRSNEQVNKINKLEAELRKWNAPHDNSDLRDMKEQSEQPSLSAKQAYINALEWHNKHLEADNARLREAIVELIAQELVPKYVEQGLMKLLDKKPDT